MTTVTYHQKRHTAWAQVFQGTDAALPGRGLLAAYHQNRAAYLARWLNGQRRRRAA